MLARSRTFFAERGVMEVDVPALRPHPPVDAQIEPIWAGEGFLHTSPEYGMKELLASGSGDIYQLSHVFRAGESGARHTPEFTMVEWYRVGYRLEQMIEETLAFLSLFLGARPVKSQPFFDNLPEDPDEQDRLLAFEIEPQLTGDCFHLITPFPADRAALAQVVGGQAQRFELYFEGVELANGYLELTGGYRERLLEENRKRDEPLPLDEHFLESVDGKLPECCGVAVGFDRLMMLRHQLSDIREASGARSEICAPH
jgi:elongation factor P--(R)-beta-lysine ligase